MSIASEITRINTNIANSYTAVDNKNGTLPQVQNSANLASAIDSIEVIEQQTAEGESLSLTNTKAMPYSDYVVEGKSEQETRSGKNLVHLNDSQTKNGVTITNNNDGTITINGTATANMDIWIANGRLYNDSSDYKQNFTAGNSFTQRKNIIAGTFTGTCDLRTIVYDKTTLQYNWSTLTNDMTFTPNYDGEIRAIELLISEGTEFKELRMFPQLERGTVATTPEMYGASPSPEYPSEIHSVADDVNLFDKEKASINSGTIKTVLDTGVRITLSSSGTFRYSGIEIGSAELLGKTITLYSTITPSSNNDGAIFLYYGNSSNMAVSAVTGGGLTNTGSKTITIANEFPTNCDRIYGLFYANRNGTGNTNDYVDYTNLKIQYGDTATPYSPYNQGTVTIKQRGKNFLNVESIFALKGSKTIDLDLEAGSYTLSLSNWSTTGGNVKSQITFNYIDGTTLDVTIWPSTKIYSLTFTKKVISVKIFSNTTDGNSGAITTTYTNLMLEKGSQKTSYEPYQTPHDYTIQTEPLRSLPNGVKDTIEADGIHRRVGRIILDELISGGKSGYSNDTYSVFYTNNYNNVLPTNPLLVSNYFINDNEIGTNLSITKEAIGYRDSNFGIRISILKSKADTFADFQTWLSTHNTEVLYPLETEVIEPFTQQQATTMLDIIKTGSYEGTTNIYTDEDVKPTMKVGHYKKG